ncbi:UvrD-helicase domain-containing protein [Alicyclobacillus cellulosilyticus]|nr:UvrD-helicase domain-containing protein [Alicyclobacillus cellulosilyticus]
MATDAGSILAGLNPEQRRAVETVDGPVLVVAGAGSGKTSVLTRRVAYLMQVRRVPPWAILAITFTNKAARELQERLTALVGPHAADIWATTFHSMCVRILRRDIDRLGYRSNFTVLDDADQLAVIRRILQDQNVDVKRFDPRAVLSAISAAKNALRSAARVRDMAGNPFERVVGDAYLEYERRLKVNNALDFDDLIMRTVQLFEQEPDVLAFYHHKFHYIHVDEYQDTNHAQYRLVSLLAQKRRNLCVVGDSDQAIYGWRGADITNILEFERDYPDATVIRLEQNYRSTKTILAIANEVIRHNQARKEKTLWTDRPQGEKATLFVAPDERAEAAYIAEKILWHRQQGVLYRDMAVLYRTNAQSRVIEELLLQAGIPYRIYGGVRFYERKEVKDILAYLRVIANPADDASLERIINVPKRGIGEGTLGRLQAFARAEGIPLFAALAHAEEAGVTPRFLGAIRAFVELIHALSAMRAYLTLTELTEAVLEKTGYREALAAEGTLEAQARLENVAELLTLTREFDAKFASQGGGAEAANGADAAAAGVAPAGAAVSGAAGGALEAFLTELALLSDTDLAGGRPQTDAPQGDEVSLMTLHSAKGLEFPVVFLPGLEEGLFPHSRALGSDPELEEERRLCYVGITRAKDKLYLTACAARTIYGQFQVTRPSRFLEEMPKEWLELDPGYRSHRTPGWQAASGAAASGAVSGRVAAADTGDRGGYDPARRGGGQLIVPKSFGADLSVSYRPNDVVEHRKWGKGTVLAVDGEGEDMELRIRFAPPIGERVLLARFAPIRKVTEGKEGSHGAR